jgi:hypothetical protein
VYHGDACANWPGTDDQQPVALNQRDVADFDTRNVGYRI